MNSRRRFCDRAKEAVQVDNLMRVTGQYRFGLLRRDDDNGRPIEVAVGNAHRGIRSSRAQGRHADRGLTGDASICVRHEGGRRLVADEDELDLEPA